MAEPSEKHPAYEAVLTEYFGDRTEPIRNNYCMVCNGPATEFKDAISEKEFTISGLCQTCQDKMFCEE